ncbi:MAG: type I methionyl aminopeptidase [bacterium]|nr:type I methionyl aminopeptidase [bacterium]
MIYRRSPAEIVKMKAAAKILVETFKLVENLVKPGVETGQIDLEIEKFIRKAGANPAFKGYRGFPASACISIDEVVVHGIPGKRSLETGQIVGIDIGVKLDGYYADAARTFAVEEISEEKRRLMDVTEKALEKAIESAVFGNRFSDISKSVQNYAESNGYSVVRELVGHGIGANLHEEPEIPNYYDENRGPMPRIMPGMVFAIEPMINIGVKEIEFLRDGWTVITADKKPSAHFEHTVAVTDNGTEILTQGR